MRNENPDSPMDSVDWYRLARLALACSYDYERDAEHGGDAIDRTMAKAYRLLAEKCELRSAAAKEGRCVP